VWIPASWRGADTLKQRVLEATNDSPVVGAEHEGISDHDPQESEDAYGNERLRHHGDDILFGDETAVEHRQSGHHEKHQRG